MDNFGPLVCLNSKAKANQNTFLGTSKQFGVSKIVLRKIRNYEEVLTQLNIVRSLHHVNIMKVLDLIVQPPDHLIVLQPFYECKTLKSKLLGPFKYGLSESTVLYLLRQILSALDYTHSKFYLHRGLKCANLFLTARDFKVVLSGFENAVSLIEDGVVRKSVFDFSGRFKHSLNWLAPEFIQQDTMGYSMKSDVYMLGACVVEMCNGVEPFFGFQPYQIMIAKHRDCQPVLIDKNTVNIVSEAAYPLVSNQDLPLELTSKEYSHDLHKFIGHCLQYNVAERPTIAELKQKFHKLLFEHQKRSLKDVQVALFEPAQICTENLYSNTDEQSIEKGENTVINWDF